MARATLLACCCFAALCAAARAAYPKDTKGAVEFCARPATKSLRCGLVSAATGELPLTTTEQCPLCGTAYVGLPETPADVSFTRNYHSWGTDVLSLSCSGRYLVRTVFKILEQPAETRNCSYARLDGPIFSPRGAPEPGPNVRCLVTLPPGPGTEEERALRSNEGPCWVCDKCTEGGGCPANLNTWYTDTVLAETKGCAFDQSTGYEAQKIGILLAPPVKLRLAKFEACNDAGCFNPAYEDAKVKNARRCVDGKCPN